MRRRGRGSRVGTIMAVIGVLGVVGGSFGLGVFVGRHWSYFSIATGTLFSRHAPAPARETSSERRRAENTEPAPSLTFYQELTQPLAGGPGGPQTPKRSAAVGEAAAHLDPPKRSATVGEVSARLEPPTLAAPPPKPTTPGAASQSGAFNVQLAAYKTREQADTLRESLASRGVTAYVSEISTPSGPRYRVRVGPFESRDAAREKAIALAADTGLGAFVTTDASAR